MRTKLLPYNASLFPADLANEAVAVLVSGGVESSTAVALASRHFRQVYPVYIQFGLSWEHVELAHLDRFLSSISSSPLRPLTILECPVNDIYGQHWSVTRKNMPSREDPESAIYLPGRNLLLLSKIAVWCSLNGVTGIVLGTLESEVLPDRSKRFFELFEQVLSTGLATPLHILRPFAHSRKGDVIRMASDFPVEGTFTCIRPVRISRGIDVHCGRCYKCAERRKGFEAAGVEDKTVYAESNEDI